MMSKELFKCFFVCTFLMLAVNFRTQDMIQVSDSDRSTAFFNSRNKKPQIIPGRYHTFPRSKKESAKDANKISVENDSSKKANQDGASVQKVLSPSCPNITESSYPAHAIQRPIMGTQILPRLLRGRDKMLQAAPIPAPRTSLLRCEFKLSLSFKLLPAYALHPPDRSRLL